MPRGIYERKKEVKEVQEEVKAVYVPKPDMGSVKPPSKEVTNCDTCSGCPEPLLKNHYGPDGKTWCNLCACQSFTAVK